MAGQCDRFVADSTPPHFVSLDIRHSIKRLKVMFYLIANIKNLLVANTGNITRVRFLGWNDATCLILGGGRSRVRVDIVRHRSRDFELLLLYPLLLEFLV